MCCQPCIVIDRQMDAAAFSQRPIMMTDPINIDHKSSLLNRLAGWWRSRCIPRAGASNSVRVADAIMNEAKPRVLAGKWPRAVNPFDLRLEQLNAFRDEPNRAPASSP
jgi:hypothetical protein